MKRALHITLNEVRLYLQDKGDLAFSLLLPVVTFALMYGAFGGQTLFTDSAYVVDLDGGAQAARLVTQLDDVDGISVDLLTEEEADAKLERSDIRLVLVIPAGFTQTLGAGGDVTLLFKQRGNGGQEGQILASIIRGIAEEMNQEFQAVRQVSANLADSGISNEVIRFTVEDLLADEREQPLVGVTEVVVGGSPDFIGMYLPGIITMYVLFALTMSAQTIVEERRRGTLERLLTTRLTAGELFFGKFLSATARGFIQALILLGLAYAVFQMFTPLSFLQVLVITFIFAAAAAALGMIIASIARTQAAANWIGVVFTMFMVMLGGTFFEVTEGSVLDTIGKISINTYANDAMRTVAVDGGSLGDTTLSLVVMAGVVVVGLILSRFLFRAVPGGK
jgi:ABC-2 type transport system permease protein